ncbi:hypothetical protein C8Q77DRAFT_1096459 [Trametes polyzona]|nr:hypothetical protein C8Q77DRAFT_1096459 [Trametes polyzona]
MPSDLQALESSSLSTMARSKLQSVVSGGVRDSCSLHRWVLLKNSITRSHTPVEPAPPQPQAGIAEVRTVYRRDEDDARDDSILEEDAFMFPDPHSMGSRSAGGGDSEKQWLDSLLEDLGDDDEDMDIETASTSVSVLAVDDDDDPLSPLCSPMSSSDDLVNHSSLFYHPPPIAIPYPIPYPPLHPPLLPSWLQLDAHGDDSIPPPSTAVPLYNTDPLPYYDADDIDDLPVPDAIEDTSDDESDVLSTPYSQSTSSLSPADPASVPLPQARTRLHTRPHVYVDTDDAYFYPFELDPPLPFHDEEHSDSRVFRPSIIQEC